MDFSHPAIYLNLLLLLIIYGLFTLAWQLLSRRLKVLGWFSFPLHLLVLGFCLRLASWRIPLSGMARLQPYAEALVIYAGLVLAVNALERLVVGYFLVRVQRRTVPDILRRFLLLLAYFVMALIIGRSYLRLDVTSLLATSAVLSFVLGLASQDLLGSILAGIVIGVERPIDYDNWVNIDNQEGKVVDITWRRTRIVTRNGDFIMVPNSQVMKNTITNYTLPDRRHRVTQKVGVHYRHPPNQVKDAMLAAARQCSAVLATPPPSVFLREFGDSSIVYRLNAWIDDYDRLEQIKDELNTYIWYQFNRRGIVIPFPIRTLHRPPRPLGRQEEQEQLVDRVVPLLEVSPYFQGIPPESLAETARRLELGTFGAGEVIFREGDAGRSLFMVVSGRAQVLKQAPGGSRRLLAELGSGEVFGEMSLLLGQERSATVRLSQDSELIEIGPHLFKDLVDQFPNFLEHLSEVVETRRHEIEELKALFESERIRTREGRVRAVLNHIRSALGI